MSKADSSKKTIPVILSALHRHLSTVGMGDVFLRPPPAHLLPSAYCKSIPHDSSVLTPEILGIIKVKPEDFVVREIISRASFGTCIPTEYHVADLRPYSANKQNASDILESVDECNEVPVPMQDEPVVDLEITLTPIDALRRILHHHRPSEASGILTSIQTLHDSVKNQIIMGNTNIECLIEVLVHQIDGKTSCLGNAIKRGGDQGSFHRVLKQVFPLLKSQVVSSQHNDPDKIPAIRVIADGAYFPLIPYLHNPAEYLEALSLFRSQGCPIPGKGDEQGRKRKQNNEDDSAGSDDRQVVIPFKLGLSKEERRKAHHFFTVIRDFDTATILDFSLQHDNGETKTSALCVKWSKHAKRIAIKKSRPSDYKELYTLCVMRKRQKEHLDAVLMLCQALKVRQADIGIAGIKDLQAVTYQFITIKDKSPQQIDNANASLMLQGVELSPIQQVDRCIQTGTLDGNRFEIILQELQRIQVDTTENGEIGETKVSCDRAHLLERIGILSETGFVNYYGEQRLGSPGEMSDVGVRSFDIGRAMLQQNFDEAVDLLMTGRLVCRSPDEKESRVFRNVRETWKESGGNAALTLESMPRSGMIRERTILEGLRRYRTSLEALRCLNFNIRMFWINAYQSYVWNTMASERIQRLGTSIAKGDLILDTSGDVVVVDDSNLASATFEMVVLPLPGYAIQYPQNEIGTLYDDLLKREKVRFDKEAPPEGTAKGDYRRLICRPANFSADFLAEDTSNVMSVKLAFDLPSGSYATMLLREFMVTTVARRPQ